MEFLELNNPKQFMQVLQGVLLNGGAIYHRANHPLVHLGLDNDIDRNYCEANNIPIFEVKRIGGAIVSNVGDFDFVIVNKNTNRDAPPILLQKLFHLINQHKLNVKWDKNDLLIEDYKVASYSYRNIPSGIYTAIHISMSVDMELIKNICKKPMIKTPKGLNDFGITNEEVKKCLFDEAYVPQEGNNSDI